MKRLLADAGFPASIEQSRTLGLEISRWAGERVSDAELVAECRQLDFDGILFLGLQPLISSSLRARARNLNVLLAATVEDDPFEAARAVGNSLAQLEKSTQRGEIYKILSREVRVWEIAPRT